MKPSRLAKTLLAGASLVCLFTTDAPAQFQAQPKSFQPPPPPPPPSIGPRGAFTIQPTPPPPAPAPTPMVQGTNRVWSVLGTPSDVDGISVGAAMSVVDAKCKEANVKCVKSVRKAGAHQLDRVRIVLPAPKQYTRAVVTGKAGTVLSVKGWYRTPDENRMTNLTKALGQPTQKRGNHVWAPANGLVTEYDLGGRSIQFIDVSAANAKGVSVTSQAFLAAAPPLSSLKANTVAATSSGLGNGGSATSGTFQKVPLNLAMQGALNAAAPAITNPLRIPVKMTLLQMKCYDENDTTSVFHGDDPILRVVGTHTSPNWPLAWKQTKEYSDIEAGNTMNINLAIFPEGDGRRFVTLGEAVGMQVSLFESDLVYDDEIDFIYPIIDYPTAVASQGKTMGYREQLDSYGTRYEITYRVEFGKGEPDPGAMSSPPRYHTASLAGGSPSTYAGSYGGSIGDSTSEATLTFLASRDPAYPNGVLYGSMKEGTTSLTVRTTRLQGNNIELVATYPSGSPAWIVGYLVGDASSRRLVGTITRDGNTRGLLLTKK